MSVRSLFRRPAPAVETAAHYLVEAVPRGLPDEIAAQAIAALGGQSFQSLALLCVTDAAGKLLGVVRLIDLFAAVPDARLAQLMLGNAPSVRPDLDQEKVASLALHHVLNAVPGAMPMAGCAA